MLAAPILIGLTVVSAWAALVAGYRRVKGRRRAFTQIRASCSGDASVPTVSVVIPALNEEASMPWVLEQMPSWAYEVVLVDGLSTDATEVVARRLRPDLVVVHQPQRGKGAALRAGFAAASGEIVVRSTPTAARIPGRCDAGRSNLNAFRDGARVLRTMVGERTRHNACRAASPISLVEVLVQSPDAAPLPAGGDRRAGERRFGSLSAAYTRPERRRRERRREVCKVVALRVDSATPGRKRSKVARGARGRRGFDALSFPVTIAAPLY